MNFGLRNWTLLRQKLPIKDLAEYLGVYLDRKLTFCDDIEHVTKNRKNTVVLYAKSEISIPLNAFLTSKARLLNQSSHMVCLSMAVPKKRI